jgi:iron complex outermembrane receptor protein
LSFYGSYSESFTPNSATAADGTLLDPERGKQYEVGVKVTFVWTADFLQLWQLLILPRVMLPQPIQTIQTLAFPLGEQRSRGIELNVAGQIRQGWNIIASTLTLMPKSVKITTGKKVIDCLTYRKTRLACGQLMKSKAVIGRVRFRVGIIFVSERKEIWLTPLKFLATCVPMSVFSTGGTTGELP